MKLTRKSFTVWLSSLPSKTTFARADQCYCPLARYLHDNGYPDARVLGARWYETRVLWLEKYSGGHQLPIWAQIFINKWDAGRGTTGMVRTALRIMRRSMSTKEKQTAVAVEMAIAIGVLEDSAHRAGLTLLGHSLNRAKNVAGWLAAGDLDSAIQAMNDKRDD